MHVRQTRPGPQPTASGRPREGIRRRTHHQCVRSGGAARAPPRVVPGRQAGGKCGRCRCAASGCQHRVRIHVKTQPLSRCMSCQVEGPCFPTVRRPVPTPWPAPHYVRSASPLAAACHPSKACASNLDESDRRLSAHTGREGGVGARRARREQRQTPRALAQLFAPPTPPCGKREPRKWYRQRFMTGLAIDSLQAFRSRTTARHRARLSHEQFASPHDCWRNRGVLSQVHVSVCQHDFVLKWSDHSDRNRARRLRQAQPTNSLARSPAGQISGPTQCLPKPLSCVATCSRVRSVCFLL